MVDLDRVDSLDGIATSTEDGGRLVLLVEVSSVFDGDVFQSTL